MPETTTAENLWIGRSVWAVLIISSVAAIWFLISKSRDRMPVALGLLSGVITFVVIAGAGALLEGLATGVAVGAIATRAATYVQSRRNTQTTAHASDKA